MYQCNTMIAYYTLIISLISFRPSIFHCTSTLWRGIPCLFKHKCWYVSLATNCVGIQHICAHWWQTECAIDKMFATVSMTYNHTPKIQWHLVAYSNYVHDVITCHSTHTYHYHRSITMPYWMHVHTLAWKIYINWV